MADKFKLNIISPEKKFLEGDCEFLEFVSTEGELGVYAKHIPLTTILEPGVLRIKTDGNVREAALHDGFVQIQKDKVTVLAESCEWPDEIDANRDRKAKERAERRLTSGSKEVDMVRAELALKKALIRIDLAGKH